MTKMGGGPKGDIEERMSPKLPTKWLPQILSVEVRESLQKMYFKSLLELKLYSLESPYERPRMPTSCLGVISQHRGSIGGCSTNSEMRCLRKKLKIEAYVKIIAAPT